jgi:hypothetical protein
MPLEGDKIIAWLQFYNFAFPIQGVILRGAS